MALGVMALSQATLKTWKNSPFVIALPAALRLNFLSSSWNASLKPKKGSCLMVAPNEMHEGSMEKNLDISAEHHLHIAIIEDMGVTIH